MKYTSTKMQEIGMRELKARASEVIQMVKTKRARYVVTQRGIAVAVISPMDSILPEKSDDDSWNKLMEIRARIGKGTQSKKSAVELLSEMRR
jgi:prevent-host-death family protein